MFFSMKNVTICYGEVEAVADISLELEEMSLIALIGSNGAGKTTLMKAICGMKEVKNGAIWFRDQRIEGLPAQSVLKLGIAHVPEGRRLFPRMTVKENLMLGCYLRRDKKEVEKDLQEVYGWFPILQEREKQLAGQLSGGQQQMVSVARALMSRPKLLLMDEPSLGLSPALVKELSGIIRSIRQRNTSIILVEQNSRMALRLAEHGYVLEKGRVVLADKAKNLLDNPYVRKAYLGG